MKKIAIKKVLFGDLDKPLPLTTIGKNKLTIESLS